MFQLTYAMHPERGTAVYIRDNLKGQENIELNKSNFLKCLWCHLDTDLKNIKKQYWLDVCFLFKGRSVQGHQVHFFGQDHSKQSETNVAECSPMS